MISQLVNEQKAFFSSGKTKSLNYRKNILKRLKTELIKNEQNIPGDAERVTFQKDQDKYFYKIKINDFQIDLAPAWKGHEKQFETIFKNPVVVDGFKFANLDVVENWKKEMVKKYHRQKDADYLEKIQEYRRR